MATSDAEICNLALARIGQRGRIQVLTEGSAESLACSLIYENARDELLRAYPWKFASKYDELALIKLDPNEVWGFSYRYPSDCWNARFILNPADRANKDPFPFEIATDVTGRLIYCDIEQAVLVYTQKITNPTIFDPLFVSALAWYVASQLALTWTEDERIRRDTVLLYQTAIGVAAGVAFNEGMPDRNQAGDIQRSRSGVGSLLASRTQTL